jgi:hypothetical protein
MPERVVYELEVVQVDEDRADRLVLAARSGEHLLDAVQDQGAVRESREGVVGREERQLLIGALALGLERVADMDERQIQGLLEHRERALAERCGEVELRGAVGEDFPGGVAPAQAQLRDLREGCGALRGELADDLPNLEPDLARGLERVSSHPASDSDGRERAHPPESFVDGVLEREPGLQGGGDDPLDDVVGPCGQSPTEATKGRDVGCGVVARHRRGDRQTRQKPKSVDATDP